MTSLPQNPPRNAAAIGFVSEPDQRLWTDDRLLGHDELDATHREFYDVVFRLLTCHDADVWPALQAFEAHARAHFEQEEGWMRTTDFPASDCHVDEHNKVLASLEEVKQAVSSGAADHTLVNRLADQLFVWFPAHADYMDSALATWMSHSRFGAKPVVLKRRVAT